MLKVSLRNGFNRPAELGKIDPGIRAAGTPTNRICESSARMKWKRIGIAISARN
jgi:hypothetical protein